MSQGVPATDPLRVFLSGKREHERHGVSMSVELGGLQQQFAAHLVDLSIGGALIALSHVRLDAMCGEGEDVFQLVAGELAEGFDLQFLDAGVVVEAYPVRLCIPSGEEDGVYLGCRFTEELSANLRERLDVADLLEHPAE